MSGWGRGGGDQIHYDTGPLSLNAQVTLIKLILLFRLVRKQVDPQTVTSSGASLVRSVKAGHHFAASANFTHVSAWSKLI